VDEPVVVLGVDGFGFMGWGAQGKGHVIASQSESPGNTNVSGGRFGTGSSQSCGIRGEDRSDV